MAYKRPEVLKGITQRIIVGCGTLKVTLNFIVDKRYENPPIKEVLLTPEFYYKDNEEITAYCCKSFLDPIARLVTWNIRRLKRDDKGSFIKQLLITSDAACPRCSIATARSCTDALARVILCYWEGHKFKDGRCYICKLKGGI